jgi:hypothetical protein
MFYPLVIPNKVSVDKKDVNQNVISIINKGLAW